MSNTTDVSWTTVLARGATKKCFVSPSRGKISNFDVPLVGEVIFEDENLKHELLVRKATAIIQQALTVDSVLFSFPNKLFGDRVEAYQAIEKQISANVDFLPLSCLAAGSSGDLLIEAKFVSKSDALLAQNSGVKIGETTYRAISSHRGVSSQVNGLTHVQFTLLAQVSRDPNFLGLLLSSLRYYGKVYQVKKFTRKGYFEGKMSVLLDTSVGYKNNKGELLEPRPLDRQLYLAAWETFAPANFKNAPPVCHFCRLSGHLRAACPLLAKRRCFGCRELGHTVRFCKAKGKTSKAGEGEALDSYVHHTTSLVDPVGDSSAVTTTDKELTEPKGDTEMKDLTEVKELTEVAKELTDLKDLTDDGVSDNEVVVADDEDVVLSSGAKEVQVSGKRRYESDVVSGSGASKYSSSASVDSPSEMLALSKVSEKTKAKVIATKNTIVPGLGSRAVKKVASMHHSSSRAHRA